MIFSPLEQFVIYSYFNWSNISFVYLTILILIYILSLNKYMDHHIGWWYKELNVNITSKIFVILTIWLFILFSNVLGMIPYTITITAQFIIVLSITIPIFIGINIFGILNHGINLTYLFLPTGVPLLLTPFISVLEIFSYFIRIISLTLRLSANMIAGHILMKIILSAFLSMPYISFLLLPFIILELIVAFLQAYVYIVLIISYYQDVLLPH